MEVLSLENVTINGTMLIRSLENTKQLETIRLKNVKLISFFDEFVNLPYLSTYQLHARYLDGVSIDRQTFSSLLPIDFARHNRTESSKRITLDIKLWKDSTGKVNDYFNGVPDLQFLLDNGGRLISNLNFTESVFQLLWTSSRQLRKLVIFNCRATLENISVRYLRHLSLSSVQLPNLYHLQNLHELRCLEMYRSGSLFLSFIGNSSSSSSYSSQFPSKG
jgi:hypothetical protein